MQFQITALGLAAILLPLTAAQAQFSCQKYVASNDLGKCQDAIKTLRGLEAKGCNIFGCIGSISASVAACAASGAQFGVDPVTDLACIGAVAVAEGACQGCSL